MGKRSVRRPAPTRARLVYVMRRLSGGNWFVRARELRHRFGSHEKKEAYILCLAVYNDTEFVGVREQNYASRFDSHLSDII